MNQVRAVHLKFLRSIFLLCAAVALNACGIEERKLHFTEEVELADGDVLIIDRQVTALPLGEIGGAGGWESKYMSFEIRTPTLHSNPPKWESAEGLVPILFDKDPDTGEWALLATFYTCETWYALGRPRPPYAEFRVQAGHWQRMPLSEKWLGRRANMLADISSGGEPDRISLSMKRDRMSGGLTAPKYRSIVTTWRTGC